MALTYAFRVRIAYRLANNWLTVVRARVYQAARVARRMSNTIKPPVKAEAPYPI
jgi:hypothetical protein